MLQKLGNLPDCIWQIRQHADHMRVCLAGAWRNTTRDLGDHTFYLLQIKKHLRVYQVFISFANGEICKIKGHVRRKECATGKLFNNFASKIVRVCTSKVCLRPLNFASQQHTAIIQRETYIVCVHLISRFCQNRKIREINGLKKIKGLQYSGYSNIRKFCHKEHIDTAKSIGFLFQSIFSYKEILL